MQCFHCANSRTNNGKEISPKPPNVSKATIGPDKLCPAKYLSGSHAKPHMEAEKISTQTGNMGFMRIPTSDCSRI